MNMPYTNGRSPRVQTSLDFDVHGLAGVRLLDATPADVAVVARQLGPLQGALGRDPDITIRFVDRLPVSSPVCSIGPEAGFTDDAFLVLGGRYGKRAQIPLAQAGGPCEMVCERGGAAVPLLIPMLNLAVLKRGAIPLHGSAFFYRNTGVVIAGWSRGSKTGTLLAFMANGAEYVADDWVYLGGDGQSMCGLPQPILVRYGYLQHLPQYWARIGRGARVRLRTTRLLARSLDQAMPKSGRAGLLPTKVADRLMRAMDSRLAVSLSPEDLFGDGGLAVPAGPGPSESRRPGPPPDKIFFILSHEAPEVTVRPMGTDEVARRMVFSLQHERHQFLSYYLRFRFAFPEARNELVEGAEELQREVLMRALAGKQAYQVRHPYPVTVAALYEGIRPFVEG